MIRVVRDCDGCGAPAAPDAASFYVATGRVEEPGCRPAVTGLEEVDLCPECQRVALRALLNALDPPGIARFLARYPRRKEKP
jgi:hypothetical protein